MIIEFKQAAMDDAGLLVDIYNASFFSDINDSEHARDMEKQSK